MNNPDPQNSQNPASTTPFVSGFSPRQWLKSKRISYLTLPLLVMATITEFIILATGWRYQQVVCLPKGMAVTFFGIGPIGATILAVELLKLPLAVWTASRQGWQKGIMVVIGLPLICLLTFQLVKDMAVYEMGVAMTPANEMLEKATEQEVKISMLTNELAAIQAKKTDRETKLGELSAKEAKAKADFEDALKRNDDSKHDAISLTDYQKSQLSDVDAHESAIIQQYNSDAAMINKSLADLRARRDMEVARDTKWNQEEARIDNDYKAKLADYQNKKAAYDKAKAEYDGANFLKRQLMTEPVDPGVPPVRQSNTELKSTVLADLDAQIKSKEDELVAADNKHRDRIAQVENEASKMRSDFDQRSGTKREEVDKAHDELLAAQATQETEWKTERKQIDADLAVAVQKVDGIQAELDAARKLAEGYYEAREADIRVTQVHRIATTVEIIRGLIKGERPVSIKATAKERGDILTDQISMVRISVYPVLAFIVAFLPTLMVEIGFSTVFEPEKSRPSYRLGFLGRHLHWLYIRAGRQKIFRAERMVREATNGNAVREKTLAEAKVTANRLLAERDAVQVTAQETLDAATAGYEELLQETEAKHAAFLKQKEEEWVANLAGMADSLTRTVAEKDSLRDLQKSEIERQVQMRQNAWSDRLNEARRELSEYRNVAETERETTRQEYQKKLLELAEDCKTQVMQARRQAADAELAAAGATSSMNHELKEALHARETAEAELLAQAESFSLRLSQAKDEAIREVEKNARQEKQRMERQLLEAGKAQRQREEEFDRQLKQREQELALAFDARLAEEQTRTEQEARRREFELGRQFDVRTLEVEARCKQEIQQREETTQMRIKQREQQLVAQTEGRVSEMQAQVEQELRRKELELERRFEDQTRDAGNRLKQELQQKELAAEARMKQREHELVLKAEAHETELQSKWNADLRAREDEWERQAESRVRSAETRLVHEAEQKEELFQAKLRQRDQQWQVKLDTAKAEIQAEGEEALRRLEMDSDAALRELETRLRKELDDQKETFEAKARQREEEITEQLTAQAELQRMQQQARWEADTEIRVRTVVEPVKAELARVAKERDEVKQSFIEGTRQVEHLEKKLTEASSFLSGWKNGNGKSHSGVA
jgi:hypothetical protein